MLDEEKGEGGSVAGLSSLYTDSAGNSLPSSPTKSSGHHDGNSRFSKLRCQWQDLPQLFRGLRKKSFDEDRELIVRQLQDCPRGYPKLAAFLDSDDNFMVYRRFGYLQSRLLLEKQDDLRDLEFQLDMLDEKHDKEENELIHTRANLNGAKGTEKRALIQQIETQFCQYSNLVAAAQTLTSMNKPTTGEYRSVEAWINNTQPLSQEENSFIYHKEDLITLRPGREHAWLDSSVEKLLQVLRCKLLECIFRSKETRKKSDGSGGEFYYTRERIERFVVLIITAMILVLLVVPIYLLYHLTAGVETATTNVLCIGVLLVFTLGFSASISLFTRAKRHEILAASAAYCAVLVVFIGNVGGRSTGS